MEPMTVVAGLAEHLEAQLRLFRELETVHAQVVAKLDSNQEMSSVLDLLTRKNQLLDAVRANSQLASGLVVAWPNAKLKLGLQPEVQRVNLLLGQMETTAQSMRKHDEDMLKRFEKFAGPAKPADRAEQSRNVMNAFRALR